MRSTVRVFGVVAICAAAACPCGCDTLGNALTGGTIASYTMQNTLPLQFDVPEQVPKSARTLRLTLGVNEITGPYAQNYGFVSSSMGAMNVGGAAVQEMRTQVGKGLPEALRKYLAESGIFARVVPGSEQADLVLDCRLKEFQAQSSLVMDVGMGSTRNTTRVVASVDAELVLRAGSAELARFQFKKTWPQMQFVETNATMGAGSPDMSRGQQNLRQSRQYEQDAFEQFLASIRESIEKHRTQLAALESRLPAMAAGPAAPPAEPLGPVRNRWAVVIGIDKYKDARIPALASAEADAKAIANCLRTSLGMDDTNLKLLLGADASQQGIRSALGTWLARKAGRDDLVLVFYSGHGAPETDYAKKSPDGLAKYLVPQDATADDLFATGIPMTEVATFFDRIESQRIVFFTDACYSGAAGGRSFAMSSFRGVQVGDPTADVAKGRGRIIVTAGDASEPAVEDKALGHGVFTYYLLEGFSGKAREGDGSVALSGLYKYVSENVTAKSKELGGNQHPVMKGEMQGDIVLVPAPKSP